MSDPTPEHGGRDYDHLQSEHRHAVAEIEQLRADRDRWRDRCEAAEESLRLTIDEGIRAW